jgi:hypothetical protein
VCSSAFVTLNQVMGEGAQAGHMSEFMALAILSENQGVAKPDKLAVLSKHPDTFHIGLFSHISRAVHVGEHYCGVFHKVVGGAGVMWHLGQGNTS